MLKAYDKCCSCRACEQICPKNAIIMENDREGFKHPTVVSDKCINCGLCENVCDFNNNHVELYLTPLKGYAAVAKDKNVLNSSSSGGAFVSLCRAINDNPVIYGCAYDNSLKICHIRIEGYNEIEKLQKSKYVQSDTHDTYTKCKNDLIDGKVVIYSGTPCQIAGLKSYLGKDYDNLYTIGLICHGVPSQYFFDKYIDFLKKRYKTDITQYSFRDKHKILSDTEIGIRFGDEKKSRHLAWGQDYFMNLYLKGMCYKEDCYDCPYANSELKRPEDITIGDCWKIEKYIPELNTSNGVSTILFNSNKVLGIIRNLSEYMNLYETEVKILSDNNPNLTNPTKKYENRDKIYNALIEGESFDKMASGYVKKLAKPHYLKVARNIIRNIIRIKRR